MVSVLAFQARHTGSSPVTRSTPEKSKEDAAQVIIRAQKPMPSDPISTKEIFKHHWTFYVSRKFNWFVEYTQILANSPATLKKFLGFDCHVKNYLILNGDEYYSARDMASFDSIFEKKFQADSNFFKKFSQKLFKITGYLEKYTAALKKTNFDGLSNYQLAQRLAEFQNYYLSSFVAAWSRPDNFLESRVKEELTKKLGTKKDGIEKIFSMVASYPALGELCYSEEPLNLLAIAREIKSLKAKPDDLPSKIDEKLNRHIERYSWLKGPILIEEVSFGRKEYLARIKEMLRKDIDQEILLIKNARKQAERNFKKALTLYGITGSLLKLVTAVRTFIFLRTYTTETSDHLFFTGRKTILGECAKRLNLSQKEVVMFDYRKIIELLKAKGRVPHQVIQQRLKEGLKNIAVFFSHQSSAGL